MSDQQIAVSISTAAEMIGTSKWLLRDHIKTGQLPVARIGRRIIVPVSSLRQFVQSQMMNVK